VDKRARGFPKPEEENTKVLFMMMMDVKGKRKKTCTVVLDWYIVLKKKLDSHHRLSRGDIENIPRVLQSKHPNLYNISTETAIRTNQTPSPQSANPDSLGNRGSPISARRARRASSP